MRFFSSRRRLIIATEIIQCLINHGLHLLRRMGNRIHFSLFFSTPRAVALACDRFLSQGVFRVAGKIFARGNRDVVVGKLSDSHSHPSDRINLVRDSMSFISDSICLYMSLINSDSSSVYKIFNRLSLPGCRIIPENIILHIDY